jgi:hypothetical protein
MIKITTIEMTVGTRVSAYPAHTALAKQQGTAASVWRQRPTVFLASGPSIDNCTRVSEVEHRQT